LFLTNKQDYLAIKFLLKYNKENNNLNNILKIYINNITKKVANNKFEAVKKEIIKAMELLDNHTCDNEYLKEKNILLNEYEIGNKKVILKSKPRYLTVTLTNKCILKCRMCKTVKLKYDFILSESYFNEIKRLIPYLQRIVWLGGEVFLYNRFFELFDISNLYRVKQNIATNGLLLNKNNIKKLLESYDLELNLSIDSLTKSTYEKIRVGAKFENLINNIELLNSLIRDKKNIRLYINVVVSEWNMEENFINYIDFCKKYNVKQIYFTLDMHEINNMKIIDNFNIKYRKILEKEFNNLNINVVFLIPFSNVYSIENKINLKQFCLQPWKSMMIDCSTIRFTDLCSEIGKMEKDSLENIWNCQKSIDLRNQILIYQNTKCGNICKNNNLDFQRFKM
ncbi:MAG: radical SAM protein, partial [Elusimicrobia bacterium]|nr:radical SAM protein [Elusimicrobiota bacterium]